MAGADTGGGVNLLALLRRVIELCMPDLRHCYRITRKAKVVASYPSDGKYYADVQPLRNDDTPDPKEPVVPKVEIPILWGGPKRGLVCPPDVGTHCDLSYYDGDPNYPRISNFRWLSHEAPECELTELIIQQEPGVSIKIDKKHKVITVTPTDVESEAGNDWTINAGNNVTIVAGSVATVKAPQISLLGNLTATGMGGGTGSTTEKADRKHEGSYSLNGSQTIQGNLTVSGTVKAGLFVGPVAGCASCGG